MARPTDKGLISKAKLTAIGDAIRGKTGGSAGLTPDQMATAIAEIKTDPKEMVSATAQVSVDRNGSGTPIVNCDFEPMFAYAYGPNTSWGRNYASAAAWRTSLTSDWTRKTANGNAIAINGRTVFCTFSCGDNSASTAYIFVVGYPD